MVPSLVIEYFGSPSLYPRVEYSGFLHISISGEGVGTFPVDITPELVISEGVFREGRGMKRKTPQGAHAGRLQCL